MPNRPQAGSYIGSVGRSNVGFMHVANGRRAGRPREARIAWRRGSVFEWSVIFRFSRPIVHAEVDAKFGLTLEGLMNHLQESAIAHADSAGFGSERVRVEQTAWLLHRAGMAVIRTPRLGEQLDTATWITSSAGSRARRSFEASVGGEAVARASYVWVYFDAVRKMPRRIDAAMNAEFKPEDGDPAVPGVEDMPRFEIANPSFEAEITMRYTDYDSNDHVNNSIYANFVQTLLHHRGEVREVSRLGLCFQREIGHGVRRVTGRLEDVEDGCRFTIESPGVVHAFGEVGLRG
ncbi:MAG TPA: acyl-ACP thioesterase domain-containing protein [Opitutaceae bacterium]